MEFFAVIRLEDQSSLSRWLLQFSESSWLNQICHMLNQQKGEIIRQIENERQL
jgi:hypothetical protein